MPLYFITAINEKAMAKDTETGIRERGCTQRNSDLCSSGEPDERGCTQGKSDLCSSPECNEDTESVQRKSGCSQGKSDLCSSGEPDVCS